MVHTPCPTTATAPPRISPPRGPWLVVLIIHKTHKQKQHTNTLATPPPGLTQTHRRTQVSPWRLIVRPGTVMPRLRAVQAVRLRVAAVLLAGETRAEPAGRVPPARGAVSLAGGAVLLVVAAAGGLLGRGLLVSGVGEERAGGGGRRWRRKLTSRYLVR